MDHRDFELVEKCLEDAKINTFIEPELEEGETAKYISIGLHRPITPADILNALYKAKLLSGVPGPRRGFHLELSPVAYLPESITFEDIGSRM